MKIGSKSSKTKMSHEITRQEQNRRNNIKRLTISAIVALILFIALTIIQSSILNQENSIKVYQVIKDINEGTKITQDNITEYFQISSIKESMIPEGYITDETLLIDKFINRKYKAKDIVTTDGVTDSAKLNISSIKNPVQVSFSLTDLSSSVSGTIREGDYVNIYGMRNGFNEDGEVVLLTNDTYTFKHVYIEKAYNASGEEIDSSDINSEASLFTITIEENDIDLFNEMLANCSIKVAKIMYETDEDYKAFLDDTNKLSNSNNKKTVYYGGGNTTKNEEASNSETVINDSSNAVDNNTSNDDIDPLQSLKDSMNTEVVVPEVPETKNEETKNEETEEQVTSEASESETETTENEEDNKDKDTE